MTSKKSTIAGNAKQDQRVFGQCPNCEQQREIKPMLWMTGKGRDKRVWYCTTCETHVPRKR